MGKRLIIIGADFSANAIPSADEISPYWAIGGFIYDQNSMLYSDDTVTIRAYSLLAGETYVLNTTSAHATNVGYKLVNVAIGVANIPTPTPDWHGVSIGAITKLVTTDTRARIAAISNMEYTPAQNCTLLVTTANEDSSIVEKN